MANENNPYSEVVGRYIKMDQKIECKCLICGEHYYVNPYDARMGKKHRECSFLLGTNKRTKTNEEFKKELELISPHIKPIEKYKNAKTIIKCYCEKHNEYFSASPDHLLHRGSGCSKCKSEGISESLVRTHEEFVEKLSKITDNIEVLGKYKKSKEKVQVKCKVCGFEWSPQASSLLSGHGCPHCVGRHKTTEEFKEEIFHINPRIEILNEYKNSSSRMLCKCKECGHIWDVSAGNLRTTGCPECNKSHGERKIQNFLNLKNISYVPQKTFPGLLGIKGKNLSYDFFVFNHILIEYQGEYHDGTAYQQTDAEFEAQKEHDRRKKEFALSNGYRLIEIWYWDYDNIDEILERELC